MIYSMTRFYTLRLCKNHELFYEIKESRGRITFSDGLNNFGGALRMLVLAPGRVLEVGEIA